MTEINLSQQEVVSLDEAQDKSRDEVVELAWEEVKPIMILRANLQHTERELAAMMVAYEKRKLQMLDQVSELEEALMQNAKALQASKNLDETLTYELKLPGEANEKGYFIRKDQ
jgi:hypothetical protein